jgi:hypothetical protein
LTIDRRAPAATALALALIAAALIGCGGDATGQGPSHGVGEEVGGSIAPLAQCRDWNAGTEAEKQATIDDIRSVLTPQSQEESRTSLSDRRAYDVFEETCAVEFAEGFKLYKLYARAAAFEPLTKR